MLANVEKAAYDIIDSYFDNTIPSSKQVGGGRCAIEDKKVMKMMSDHFQRSFAYQLGGASESTGSCNTTPSAVANPLSYFQVPRYAPVGTSSTVDVTLPEVNVQPYVKYMLHT